MGGPHRDTWPLISGKKRPKTSGDASVPRGTGMIAYLNFGESLDAARLTSTIPVARFIADARFLAARGSTNMLALLGGSSSAWSMRPSMASRPLFIRRLSSPPPRRLGMCAPQAPAQPPVPPLLAPPPPCMPFEGLLGELACWPARVPALGGERLLNGGS